MRKILSASAEPGSPNMKFSADEAPRKKAVSHGLSGRYAMYGVCMCEIPRVYTKAEKEHQESVCARPTMKALRNGSSSCWHDAMDVESAPTYGIFTRMS